jgi:hypothetical protein
MTNPDHNIVSSPGGGLAAKFAKVVADASIYSKQQLSPHMVKLAVQAFTDSTNHVSDEVRGVFGPVFQRALDDPDMPEIFKPLLQQLAQGRGQAWAWIAGSTLGLIMGGALQQAMLNAWLPVSYSLVADSPNLLVDSASLAAAEARGIIGTGDAYEDAAKQGLRAHRFDTLRELARTRIDLTAVLQLFRMGTFDQQEAIIRLHRLGMSRDDALTMLNLAVTPLTPQEAADAVNRDLMTLSEGKQTARVAGVSSKDFERLVGLGGMPLSPQELGDAYRRGFIDKARFNLGIVQGPIRKEWFDVLEQLQYARMSTVDAADAVNQGHLTLDEGKRIAHENGLVADDFATLIETAGAPPGIEFATEALNRGLITEAQFREMFLESRIKNRYLPLMLKMRTRLIPQETVRLLYRNGVYSREDTLRVLQEHGFSPDDSAALLALEDTRQDETTRELTRAQIVDMYDEQIIDGQTARDLLKGLGYADANVELMMALADIKRTQRYINAAITRVRSAYLTGKIDENEVSLQLDALSVAPAQRDELISIWEIDKLTVSKTLTPAQIRQALKKDLISESEAVTRLVAQGYDENDANIYIQLTA